MTHEEIMKVAIQEAELSVKEGQGPFAVVVVDPQGNIAWKDHDRQKEQEDIFSILPQSHAQHVLRE